MAAPTRTKSAAAKKAVAKKAAANKAPVKRAPVSSGNVKVLTPGDQGFDSSLGRRQGRRDEVSPELTPILEQLLDDGNTEFQLADREPFTIYQVRGWASRLMKSGNLPDGVVRIRVNGGSQADEEPRNINVSVVLAD